jgi:hypothetical protein
VHVVLPSFLSQNNKSVQETNPFTALKHFTMISSTQNNQRLIGTLTILSGIIALGSMTVGLLAGDLNFEAFSNPVLLLDMTGNAPLLIKWFMLLDMFGYYLLLLPVIWFLHRQLSTKTSWAALITSAGFAYVVIGAIGAAALAVAWPSFMIHYQDAAAANKEAYKAAFLLSNDLVVKGMWNTLEVWLAGVWWLGVGIHATHSRSLKVTTITLGVGCLMDGLGEAIGSSAIAELGLNIYLLLAIVWAVWMGIGIVRKR